MKTLIAMSSLGVIALASAAQADLISYWNFSNLPAIATAGTPVALGINTITATTGPGAVSLTNYLGTIDDFGGSTINALNADPAGASLSLVGGAASGGSFLGNGSSISFSTNLSGFTDPIVTFATQRTATGFNSDQFAYSVNGGASFVDFGAAYTPASAFALQTIDLSSVSALDNASNVVFRITFNGVTSGAGNNRIDNIQVNATAPTPGAFALLGLGGLVMARRRR